MTRRRSHFVQRTVNPVANFEFCFERLKMDVGCAILNCLVKNQVDVANNRSRVRLRLETLEIDLPVGAAEFNVTPKFLEDLIHAGGIGSVIFLEEFVDLVNR